MDVQLIKIGPIICSGGLKFIDVIKIHAQRTKAKHICCLLMVLKYQI